VEQIEPGVVRWILPSGRTHTTRPTVYELGDPRIFNLVSDAAVV
jgi:hypothetical protein